MTLVGTDLVVRLLPQMDADELRFVSGFCGIGGYLPSSIFI